MSDTYRYSIELIFDKHVELDELYVVNVSHRWHDTAIFAQHAMQYAVAQHPSIMTRMFVWFMF